MIQTTVLIRNIGALVSAIISVIALGLASHVYQASSGVGYKPSALVVNIVSAAWTLASELILAISRYVSPGAFLTTYLLEMAVLLVTTILWLVSGDLTSQARNICSQLDNLSSRAEYKDADPSQLQHAQNVLSDVCSELNADYGFIWLSFVVAILQLGLLGVQAVRMRERGVPKILLKPLGETVYTK